MRGCSSWPYRQLFAICPPPISRSWVRIQASDELNLTTLASIISCRICSSSTSTSAVISSNIYIPYSSRHLNILWNCSWRRPFLVPLSVQDGSRITGVTHSLIFVVCPSICLIISQNRRITEEVYLLGAQCVFHV